MATATLPPPVHRRRLPILALGFMSLVTALAAGLVRLGWDLPLRADLALLHGPLMVSGFFGTVIALERAVALARPWAYAAPLAAGLGALATAAVPGPFGPALLVFASAGLAAAAGLVWTRQRALFTAAMALGALCWLVGNLLWLAGGEVPALVLWWLLFPVLTIAGERLELNRFLPPGRWTRPGFVAAVAVLLAGAALAGWDALAGWRVAGVGMVALALWLLRFDIARRTVRGTGLTRYVAVCLLSGYFWLGAAGLMALALPDPLAGFGYDAVLHAVFLGFVFAMVFGHAPIILPAVLRLTVPFRAAFYVHLAALNLTLALRVGGDLLDWLPGRMWGGLGSVAALALFVGVTAFAVAGRRGALPPGTPCQGPRALGTR